MVELANRTLSENPGLYSTDEKCNAFLFCWPLLYILFAKTGLDVSDKIVHIHLSCSLLDSMIEKYALCISCEIALKRTCRGDG